MNGSEIEIRSALEEVAQVLIEDLDDIDLLADIESTARDLSDRAHQTLVRLKAFS